MTLHSANYDYIIDKLIALGATPGAQFIYFQF